MSITRRVYRNKKRQVVFYQAEYFRKGVRVSSRSFARKVDAVCWLQDMDGKSFSFNKVDMSFKVCVDQFFTDAKTRLTSSTFNNYKRQARCIYKSDLCLLRMSELRGVYVMQWLSWLRQSDLIRNYRRKSFSGELKLLSTILGWYKNYVNEDFNIPITKKHKKMCFYKKNMPRPMDYFIKPKDVGRWVAWLKRNKHPVYWRLALFMLSTGVRVGEACGVKWSDIDFEQGMARLTQKVRWDFSTKKPLLESSFKTSSERMIVIPKALAQVLLEIKEESRSSLVFVDKKNGILKYTTIQAVFNAGFIALDLPWRSTHICRHTFATIALMTTKNLPAVQASLGHKEIRTTQKYAKVVSLLNSKLGEKTFSFLFKDQFSP